MNINEIKSLTLDQLLSKLKLELTQIKDLTNLDSNYFSEKLINLEHINKKLDLNMCLDVADRKELENFLFDVIQIKKHNLLVISKTDMFKLCLESMNLGMKVRQDQLNGYCSKSGKEILLDWFKNELEKL